MLNGFKVFDAFMEFAGQGFEAGGWDIAESSAKDLLPKGVVSSLYFRELLVGGSANFILRLVLSFGLLESSSRRDARLQAIKVGLETPSWRAIREKLKPAMRRRRNSLRVARECMN